MSEDRRAVAITGYGVFSCFGHGPEALRDGVFEGRAGFTDVTRFDVSPRRSRRAAQALGSPVLADVFESVARDALAMAGYDDIPSSAAILLGTQGGWQGLTSFWRGETNDADPAALAGTHAHGLGTRLGIAGGRRRVFNNACIAAASAVAHGMELIATGREDVVLAGGGYLVDEEFFAKFDSGQAFAADGFVRPFSADRKGMLLGDGVAILVMEPAGNGDVPRRGGSPAAIAAGAGLAADSYHVCRPHPEGVGLASAMSLAFRRAGLKPEDIDYVNAHGTGTAVNDSAEVAALRTAFGGMPPPTSSTKGSTGHCLEGSAALEAVICLLALRDGVMPPTAGFTGADPECDIDCIPGKPRYRPLDAVLTASMAFGGATAALILVRAQ